MEHRPLLQELQTATEAEKQTLGAAILLDRYHAVRRTTVRLTEPLETEDFVIQSMPDSSPAKWHLAHTSWFFETFVLKELDPAYRSPNPLFDYLFNSYYNLVGDRWARPKRGLLSRPTVREVFEYREHVDQGMDRVLSQVSESSIRSMSPIITLGLNHEQQHQELLLTDIKHLLGLSPLYPAYAKRLPPCSSSNAKKGDQWLTLDEGIYEIGYAGNGFAFDNESPRHRVYLEDFAIRSTLVTNGEFLDFIKDGGYARPEIWLSDGWNELKTNGAVTPLYWQLKDDSWHEFSLHGLHAIDLNAPVTHVSYYEAAAFAAWYGARLPREDEWEVAANTIAIGGSFLESEHFHPVSEALEKGELTGMFGQVWQWTESAYLPYPGYIVPPGAIGEYNGKFMSGQMVLRGGSSVTPRSHIRRTYRNFFPPAAKWQFSGIRLAKS